MKPLKKHINAVKKTIKMWEWLRDNPDKEKEDYLKYFGFKNFHCTECFLCGEWNNMVCYKESSPCPLANKIGRRCRSLSPFYKWDYAKQKVARRRNAQIIVDLCKDWLKKYGVK